MFWRRRADPEPTFEENLAEFVAEATAINQMFAEHFAALNAHQRVIDQCRGELSQLREEMKEVLR